MKLEIIIPAYNCSATLHRTLSSLEAQTDDNFSVHIVDDCSSEDLSLIVKQHNRLNIKLTRNVQNLGCGMSRQVGLDLTDVDYIAFLDSDDMLMPYTVETWRNMALGAPDVDVFHSYFLEQTILDGAPSMILHKDGHTWCHGKLYKTSFIKKWDIRNSPEVKYADDSYFNSMCTELGQYAEIPIAMYLWTNNLSSITRSSNILFQKNAFGDFVHAMRLSVQFVKSKGVKELKYINNTIKNIEKFIDNADEYSKNEFQSLLMEV